MKQLIKKQNSKFTPYWNYSVEGLVQEARKQQQDYLDKPAQWHIDEVVELNRRFKEKLNDDKPIDIERITKNINEYIETAKTILQYSVEEYYDKYLCYVCDLTGECIPYDTEYYCIEYNEDVYIVLSKNGLKQFIEQATEILK